MREGKRMRTRRKGDGKENIRGGREDAEEERIKQKRVGGRRGKRIRKKKG